MTKYLVIYIFISQQKDRNFLRNQKWAKMCGEMQNKNGPMVKSMVKFVHNFLYPDGEGITMYIETDSS